MPRKPRFIIPGLPVHIVQRGGVAENLSFLKMRTIRFTWIG